MVALSPDLKDLAWNYLDPKAMRPSLRFTELAGGEEPRGNPFLSELPPAMAFSADGRSLLWAGNDQNVHITEIATEKETVRTEIAGLNAPICGLTLSPDGKTLAVGRVVVDRPEIRVELWNLASGKRLHAFVIPEAPDLGVVSRLATFVTRSRGLAGAWAFSPDGTVLALGLGDAAAVRLFEVQTGREIPTPGEGHRGTVEALQVTSGGNKVHTFARGDGVLAWNMADGTTGPVPLPEDADAVAFSADGIAARSRGGMVEGGYLRRLDRQSHSVARRPRPGPRGRVRAIPGGWQGNRGPRLLAGRADPGHPQGHEPGRPALGRDDGHGTPQPHPIRHTRGSCECHAVGR